MARFTIPRDVYYGPGAISELKVLEGHSKAFIVTGTNFINDNGSLEKLTDILDKINIEYKIFTGVESNPLISTAYRGAEEMRAGSFTQDRISQACHFQTHCSA